MAIGAGNRNDYVGNGAAATYPFTFKIFAETDLAVTQRDTNGGETVLAWPGNFSVSGVGLAAGGSITLTAGNLTNLWGLTIKRIRPLTQATSLRNQSAFFASVHEDTFDHVVMLTQQLTDMTDRALKVQESLALPGMSLLLPPPAAGHVLGWDPLAKSIINIPVGNNVPSSMDAPNVTFLQLGAGAVQRTVRDRLRETVSVKDFGAVGDGAADDTVALNTAFALVNTLVNVPPGTYKVTSNLVSPVCGGIIGAPGDRSILKPFAAVTKLLPLTSASPLLIQDLKLDGSLTNNATGIFAGESGQTWSGRLVRARITSFGGASGVGLRVGDSVGPTFYDCLMFSNGTGVVIQGASSEIYPTNVRFVGGRIGSNTTKGLRLVSCVKAKFIGTIFESNTQEGVYVSPNTGDAQDFVFDSCHFEANNGDGASNYQMKFAGANGRTIRGRVTDCWFLPDGATKNINVDATLGSVSGLIIDNPQMENTPGLINIVNAGSPSGLIVALGNNLATDVVNDPGGFFVNTERRYHANITNNLLTAWTPYVPVYSSSAGSAAASFTGGGAVTTATARYKQIGKTLEIIIAFSATLLNITPVFLQFSLPAPFQGLSASDAGPVTIKDGTFQLGVWKSDGAQNIIIYRGDFGATNFGANNAVAVQASIRLETQ